MKAKARTFLVPDASVCFTREAPISYIMNPRVDQDHDGGAPVVVDLQVDGRGHADCGLQLFGTHTLPSLIRIRFGRVFDVGRMSPHPHPRGRMRSPQASPAIAASRDPGRLPPRRPACAPALDGHPWSATRTHDPRRRSMVRNADPDRLPPRWPMCAPARSPPPPPAIQAGTRCRRQAVHRLRGGKVQQFQGTWQWHPADFSAFHATVRHST